MDRMLGGLLVLLLGLSPVAAGDERPAVPATPAEESAAMAKEFNREGFAFRQAETDEEREAVVLRVEKLTLPWRGTAASGRLSREKGSQP